MQYLGNYLTGEIIYFAFNTRDTNGVPITLAGTPTVRVYKDDGTGEDDSGITLTVDFDSRTGLHVVKIDTSADGTFYAAGADFHVVLTAGTVDSISVVGVCVGMFSLDNRASDVRHWKGTAVPAPHTNGYPVVTIKDGTGTGELDTSSGEVLVAGMSSAAVGDILTEPIANHEASFASRCLGWAISKLTNRVVISGGTLTVYKTNDTDALFTQAATSDASADPITEVNTN